MEEVVTRRLAHVEEITKNKTENSIENAGNTEIKDLNEKNNNKQDEVFLKKPDAIFADGGITQIRAIRRAVDKYSLDIKIFGMVKNDKHKTRALLDENRNEIEISEKLFNVITNFQDTVHNTAITYHTKIRDKELTKSRLDNVKGIGETKKKLLLKQFGSIEQIKNAKIEDLIKVKGINKNLAEEILKNI